MSLLSKLFGAGRSEPKTKPAPQPEDYKGFLIFPDPIADTGGFRIAARIEKEVGGELKTHKMIRADTVQSEDEAKKMSLRKAQIFIDQMGEGVFR